MPHVSKIRGTLFFVSVRACIQQTLTLTIQPRALKYHKCIPSALWEQLFKYTKIHTLTYFWKYNWAGAWDFQQFDILTSVDSDKLCSLLLSLETPNGVQSVA